jgi:GT2 family glycosyltransferase
MTTPMLSLIVLSFRRFEINTGPCLETLVGALDDRRIQLILVDNASDDGAADQCGAWAASHPGTLYLPQPRNLGFAGGMNVGAAVAAGEWLILVNNDTLFPHGALKALIQTLEHVPPHVAMVGPVSNAAGNGQRLLLPDVAFELVAQIGLESFRAPTGLLTPTYRSDFFCVAVRSAVWQQLGGLDTAFGLGYYEDFDFSLRLRRAGYTQVIAEDVFIAHMGSASFATLGGEQQALLKRNRALLRKRHPNVHFEHAREGNAKALRHLLAEAQRCGWTEGLRHRAAWRLAALLHDEAKSPFKRWRWRWATRDIRRTLAAADIHPRFPSTPTSTTHAKP